MVGGKGEKVPTIEDSSVAGAFSFVGGKHGDFEKKETPEKYPEKESFCVNAAGVFLLHEKWNMKKQARWNGLTSMFLLSANARHAET